MYHQQIPAYELVFDVFHFGELHGTQSNIGSPNKTTTIKLVAPCFLNLAFWQFFNTSVLVLHIVLLHIV